MNLKIKRNNFKYFSLIFIITIVLSCNYSKKNTIVNKDYTKKDTNTYKIKNNFNRKNYYYLNCDSLVQGFVDSCFNVFLGKKRISSINKKDAIAINIHVNLDGFIIQAEVIKNTILTENEKKIFIQFLLKQKCNTPCIADYIYENISQQELEKMGENQEEFYFSWTIFVYNRSND